MEELITVDDLAKRLKVPRSWVYGKTREKGTDVIPKVRIGKYIRFYFKDVTDWLKRLQKEKYE